MTFIFAGVLLGFLILFFVLAFATGALVIFVVPLVLVVIIGIQTFLKIRDRNA